MSKTVTDAFMDWWISDGQYIDPDSADVSWFDKRRELALLAWIAATDTTKPKEDG